MARSRRRTLLEPLLERLSPELERAFLAAVALIRREADLAAMVQRIIAGDVEGALDALRIDDAAFSGMRAQIAQAFAQGGAAGTSSMPKRRPDGQTFIIRFDAANPDAEQWLKDYSSNAIREIVDDQKAMVKNALVDGMERGINPRRVALDIVGRVDKKTGRRIGGLIGLTSEQQRIVSNAAEELSGSDAQLRAYLSRKARDKRFDRHVLKALKDGTPIPADTIARMIGRYKDNLLKLRGETIGRTEAMAALHSGRYQAFAQAIMSGEVSADEVERTWQSAGDRRVRESHREMNGQTVTFYQHYTTPSGAKLLYPGDPKGPAREIINCRCTEDIRINFFSRLRRRP